ncbi:MAG: DUF2723 domain-containing protein [Chloroflexia bacterium]
MSIQGASSQIPSESTTQLSSYVPLRRPGPWQRVDWLIFGLPFLLSLGLYTATLAPTINTRSFDSAELITKSALPQVAHMPGSPLYEWLGYVFSWLPFGELAARVNWMSAFFGAIAVALLYVACARHVTGERWSAVGAAALFALSLTFWSQAVLAELYAPNMAFLALSMLALLEWATRRGSRGMSEAGGGRGLEAAYGSATPARWWLVLSLGTLGLSLGVHASNILYVPAFGLFIILGWPVRRAAREGSVPPGSAAGGVAGFVRRFDIAGGLLAALAFAVALVVPYTWVYLTLPGEPPGDAFPKAVAGWPLFYESTFNAFHHLRFAYSLQEVPDRIAFFLHMMERNLGPLGLALFILGAWRLLFTQVRLFWLLLPAALANLVFYINYKVPDNDVYYIPAYWIFAGLAGLGAQVVAVALGSLVAALQHVPQAIRPARLPDERPGLVAPLAGTLQLEAGLPGLALLLVLLGGIAWQWNSNYAYEDLSRDVTNRDFYGNELSMLPKGAYLYHRGAALGYDLLYYTRLCGVRPDLHVQAGPEAVEAASPPPWPPGPAYSNTTEHEVYLPDFVANPRGDNRKWYDPALTGMYPLNGSLQYGWLNMYTVRPADDPPMNWMVSIKDPASHPSKLLDVDYTSLLQLVGVDADPVAYRGRPWHLVRYWYVRGNWLPPMVTILGDHLAVETHIPLFEQFEDYVKARGISDLGLYVVKEDLHLIIPSNVRPGQYIVSNAMATTRLTSLILDPASPNELFSHEVPMTSVQVLDDPTKPPLDPLALGGNGRCSVR